MGFPQYIVYLRVLGTPRGIPRTSKQYSPRVRSKLGGLPAVGALQLVGTAEITRAWAQDAYLSWERQMLGGNWDFFFYGAWFQQTAKVYCNCKYVEIVNQKKMIDNVMIMSRCSWFDSCFSYFSCSITIRSVGYPDWWRSGPKLPWFVARNGVLCPFFNVACQK